MFINWKTQYCHNVSPQTVPSKFIKSKLKFQKVFFCIRWQTATIIYVKMQKTLDIKEMKVKTTMIYHYSP